MITVLSIILILVGAMNVFSLRRRRERLKSFYNVEIKSTSIANLIEDQFAEKKSSSFFSQLILDVKTKVFSYYSILILGQSQARLIIYILVGVVVGIFLNQEYIGYDNYIAIPFSFIATIVCIIFIKKKLIAKKFYETFPEALNIFTGVVSSGYAVTTGFKVCANSIDGIVGKMMKEIDNRLEFGESVESVLLNSYRRLPFIEYYFFILTIMVNVDSGGELKEIFNRLSKVLTNNRVLKKTLDGKTAELRMTMKILGGMPFAFIFALKGMSETHYQYLVDTTVGHYILYYVTGSVFIGVLIIKHMISKII
jgi:tight adherence protein B